MVLLRHISEVWALCLQSGALSDWRVESHSLKVCRAPIHFLKGFVETEFCCWTVFGFYNCRDATASTTLHNKIRTALPQEVVDLRLQLFCEEVTRV